MNDKLIIAGKSYSSRLLVGTGKYKDFTETIAAAKTLVAEGFEVMVYTSDDPIIAKQLEDIGCVAIMPLASLIGSGMGILNPWNLQLIMEPVSYTHLRAH